MLDALGPVTETESIWPRQGSVGVHFEIPSFGKGPHNWAAEYISMSTLLNVTKQLGHSSVKITMDIYYHWMPGGKKSQVDALDDVEYQEQSTKAENE